ncbi:MAG TPA: heavy-metal-associated domain-containing protein [Bacteroidales bacterium]|nr:heavy-metal-associated domain-containing protein [Bacteroidales bacterium]
MKKSVLILTAIIFAVISVSAQELTEKKDSKKNDKISEVTLSCKMECGNCANDVKKQLAFTKGVKYVETDYEKDLVLVKYRNDRTDVDKIIASLGEIKYVASVYNPGCPNAKKSCCPGKTQTGGCSGAGTVEKQHTSCEGKTATSGDSKTGCCSGKNTGSEKK